MVLLLGMIAVAASDPSVFAWDKYPPSSCTKCLHFVPNALYFMIALPLLPTLAYLSYKKYLEEKQSEQGDEFVQT